MSECVCCDATVPEGRQVCLICEKGEEMKLLKKKKLAYVAGPYRSKLGRLGILINIMRARKIARLLWKQGYAVICPHSNSAFMSGKDIAEFHFLQGYCTILEKCDVAVFLPGWEKSEGSKEEMQVAYNNKLEIFEWNSLADRTLLMKSQQKGA